MYKGQFIWFIQTAEVIRAITEIEFEQLTEDQQDFWYPVNDGTYQKVDYIYSFY